ncbi:DUF3732 domain-containing protein [Clostridium frigidicarnis]|uniref:Nuclease SbcCD subunit C n=1 Tax=Clostridium frigidicarnis TaxID=84698 RepID=A0A1I0Y6A2_9CLOT|nr:DUF3732 domain-containing protein [Clostridium frigidicarnis]SFB08286.1 Protein of unknown function [Clostridium frigidicarnis]
MQILELIIYGKKGQKRTIPFNLGKLNVICGKSKSGKSAVGDIIDYCLGGDSCNIADGVVRDHTAWYGLLLQFDDERVFVARKNPEQGQQTTSYCYVEIGKDIISPCKCDFSSNENVAGLEETLSRRLGIGENLNIPPEGQTRNALAANIRHSLYYCFQNQDEIAAKNFLFHKQSDDFITQAIKDTLPYFLGIVSEDTLALEHERILLKRKIVTEKRRLEEERSLQGGGMARAISLIAEAKQVGILNPSETVNLNDYDTIFECLSTIDRTWQAITIVDTGMNRLSYLQAVLNEKLEELEEVNHNIDNAKVFAGEALGYTKEVGHQKARLESIGLFEQIDFNPNACPFCSGTLETPIPEIEMMKKAIINLDLSIANVSRERPKLRKYIDELESSRQHLREEIRNFKAEIEGIYLQNVSAQQLKDLNTRRAKVVGRISLWLESVSNDQSSGNRENTIKGYEQRLEEINTLLNVDDLEDRKQSALSRISVDMSEWAKILDLEHCENPYRLDMNKATVVVDKPDRPVPLKQLGSGSNWVGVHLITYFALQKYFISANRPVPRFLFIDQPSQVYFPSEHDEEKTDWAMVNSLYRFIIDRIAQSNQHLQVIIVDHADIADEDFKNAVIENWWGSDNLIPEEWYKEQ